MFYQKPYYLLPDKSDKAYWLLYHSLKKSGKVGIARFAVHSREHLALGPVNNALALCNLYYPEEIRRVNEIPAKPDTKQLEMAISLIEQQTIDFEPECYNDRYQEALVKMLEGKRPVPAPEQPQRVTDLMEALREIIEKAKEKRKLA